MTKRCWGSTPGSTATRCDRARFPWRNCCRTNGVCSRCSATSGNGRSTAVVRIPRMGAYGKTPKTCPGCACRTMWPAPAAVGLSPMSGSRPARRIVAMSPIFQTRLVTQSDFVWPGRCRAEFLNLTAPRGRERCISNSDRFAFARGENDLDCLLFVPASVFGWALDGFDDHHRDLCALRFQLQSKLLLERH